MPGYQGQVNSASSWQTFVLEWTKKNVLDFYSVDDSGNRKLLMSSPPQTDTLDVTAIGFATGWGSTGQWKIDDNQGIGQSPGTA